MIKDFNIVKYGNKEMSFKELKALTTKVSTRKTQFIHKNNHYLLEYHNTKGFRVSKLGVVKKWVKWKDC